MGELAILDDQLRARIRNSDAKRLIRKTRIKENRGPAGTHYAEQCGKERRLSLSGDRNTTMWLLRMNCLRQAVPLAGIALRTLSAVHC